MKETNLRARLKSRASVPREAPDCIINRPAIRQPQQAETLFTAALSHSTPVLTFHTQLLHTVPMMRLGIQSRVVASMVRGGNAGEHVGRRAWA